MTQLPDPLLVSTTFQERLKAAVGHAENTGQDHLVSQAAVAVGGLDRLRELEDGDEEPSFYQAVALTWVFGDIWLDFAPPLDRPEAFNTSVAQLGVLTLRDAETRRRILTGLTDLARRNVLTLALAVGLAGAGGALLNEQAARHAAIAASQAEMADRDSAHQAAQTDTRRQLANALLETAANVWETGQRAFRNGDLDQAEPAFIRYAALTEQIYALDPAVPLHQAEWGYGALNLGVIHLHRGRADQAVEQFNAALTRLRAVDPASGAVSPGDIANVLAFRSDAALALGALDAALRDRLAEQEIYAQHPASPARQARSDLMAAQIETAMGDAAAAERRSAQALAVLNAVITARREQGAPVARNLYRMQLALMRQRAYAALADGRLYAAQLLARDARNTQAAITEPGAILQPIEAATFALLHARIALSLGAYDDAESNARDALGVLDEIRSDQLQGPGARAMAREILGEVYAARDSHDLAQRAFQADLNAIDEDHSVYALPVRARLLARAGQSDQAQSIREGLALIGYADGLDAALWRGLQAPATASTPATGDQNGG
jgi:hypothetical protein